MSWSGVLNSQVHEWHGQLEEAGKKIGKGEYDVIVDISRQEGNLQDAGFNLPEFSLLTTDDVFLGNAGTEEFVPRDGKVPRRKSRSRINKAAPILAPQGRGISRVGTGLLFWKKKRPPALNVCQSLYPVAKLRGIRLPIKTVCFSIEPPP